MERSGIGKKISREASTGSTAGGKTEEVQVAIWTRFPADCVEGMRLKRSAAVGWRESWLIVVVLIVLKREQSC